jgi:hypothetical protein
MCLATNERCPEHMGTWNSERKQTNKQKKTESRYERILVASSLDMKEFWCTLKRFGGVRRPASAQVGRAKLVPICA